MRPHISYLIIVLVVVVGMVFPTTTIAQDKISPDAAAVQAEAIAEQQRLIEKQAEEARIQAYSRELTQRAEKLVGTKQGQCVLAARRFLFGNENLGKEYVQGYVRYDSKKLIHDPVVGSLIIFVGGWRHTGVTLFSTATEVWYYDSNGDLKGTAKIRSIKLNDPWLKGFIPIN